MFKSFSAHGQNNETHIITTYISNESYY